MFLPCLVSGLVQVAASMDRDTYLTEDHVEPALVGGIGDDDQDGEEEQGEDSLPDLYSVLSNRGDYQTWH